MPRRVQLAAGQRRAAALVAVPAPESFTMEQSPEPVAGKPARKVPASGVRRKRKSVAAKRKAVR